jgi:hypothetical protein
VKSSAPNAPSAEAEPIQPFALAASAGPTVIVSAEQVVRGSFDETAPARGRLFGPNADRLAQLDGAAESPRTPGRS